MTYLNKKVIDDLKDVFKEFKKEVVLKFFTQEMECRFCKETHGLLEELSALSDKIKLEVYDFVKDKAEAEKYGVDKIPATVVMDESDHGIKIYGNYTIPLWR